MSLGEVHGKSKKISQEGQKENAKEQGQIL
jgi:hypothetical protein